MFVHLKPQRSSAVPGNLLAAEWRYDSGCDPAVSQLEGYRALAGWLVSPATRTGAQGSRRTAGRVRRAVRRHSARAPPARPGQRVARTSFWMVENVSRKVLNVENGRRTRFGMLPSQFVSVF